MVATLSWSNVWPSQSDFFLRGLTIDSRFGLMLTPARPPPHRRYPITTFGCGDSNPTSPPREIEVTVTTDNVGGDMDPDGYTLTFDDQSSQHVDVNGVVRWPAVSNGRHSLQLTGMAPNCVVEGDDPRLFDLVAGTPRTLLITFTVHCGAPPPDNPWDY